MAPSHSSFAAHNSDGRIVHRNSRLTNLLQPERDCRGAAAEEVVAPHKGTVIDWVIASFVAYF
jgi:hypothetical protein